MTVQRLLLTACLLSVLSFGAQAEAPVVDESENYALLDEQPSNYRTANHEPRSASSNHDFNDEETPLAHDAPEQASNHSNTDVSNQIAGLQQEVQELRGQLEVQTHELKTLKEQQLSFYKDLDARLRSNITSKGSAQPPVDMTMPLKQKTAQSSESAESFIQTEPLNIRSSTNPADEQISYLAAYDLVKANRHDEAIAAMQQFVVTYPEGGYTANAHYWLGETYLQKHDYTNAISQFEVVLKKYPSSSKTAPSMLNVGYALAASGKKEDAIQQLKRVVTTYPDTRTARLAAAKLNALKT